jgi:hypothetical protein
MLVTDTNILQRVSQGRAMLRVETLRLRGIRLATTERNAFELHRVLTRDLGFVDDDAVLEVSRVIAPFEMIYAHDYEHLRADADARLRDGGKSDWPALAAAMAFEAAIWSDDIDFFGVGLPIWSTNNVHFYEEADGA